jgi:hypothetical protein
MAKVNPIQLQKALKGVNYPAGKNELIEAAKRNGGDQNIADTLGKLPERQYQKPSDVSKALGEME